MPKTIAVFGAGSGLGQAIAHRYAREGYDVVLVGRRREPLEHIASDLRAAGAIAHAIDADLSRIDAIPQLAARVRAAAGNVEVLYYAPTSDSGFATAVNLTPEKAAEFMPLGYYALVALVREFLPHMLEQGDGAILTAQGASTTHGLPYMTGPGPSQAAQRNYLQSLHAEVGGRGVYVGSLYVGAAIEKSAFHVELERKKAAGESVWEMAVVSPDHLAEQLWTMHRSREQAEASYP